MILYLNHLVYREKNLYIVDIDKRFDTD